MLHALSLSAPLMLAAVLALSGVAKLRAPDAARDAFVSLRLPRWLSASPAPRLLPWAELLLALVLLTLPGWGAVVAAGATLALMLAYVVVVWRALGFGVPVDCGCFGELGMGTITRWTVARNVLLSVLGVLAVAGALGTGGSPLQSWLRADAGDAGWLVVLLLGVVSFVLIARGGPAGEARPLAQEVDEQLDYLRRPTPYAELTDEDGQVLLVRELARRQALLLIFVNPYCGSCLRTLERLPLWRGQLEPLVGVRPVFAGYEPGSLGEVGPEVTAVLPGALYDPHRHLAALLETHGSPSAVLLGTDDLLAGGPVTGTGAVADLVADIVAELAAAQALTTGTELRAAPGQEAR